MQNIKTVPAFDRDLAMRPINSVLLMACLGLAGCQKADTVPSTDLVELNSIVTVDIPSTVVRYELVTLPESGGFLPGPTDYVFLIAEYDVPKNTPNNVVAPTQAYEALMPRAGRPWLSEPFRAMLRKNAGNRLPLANSGCAPLSASITQSKRPVTGFSCRVENRVLAYLTLVTPDDNRPKPPTLP